MPCVRTRRQRLQEPPQDASDAIRATFDAVRQKIASKNLCLDATIDDYPIGRRERGKCRPQVERAVGKGYRTVRTMTNKLGRWCAPEKVAPLGKRPRIQN